MPEIDDLINDAAPDAEFSTGDKLLGRSAATGGIVSFDPASVAAAPALASEFAPLESAAGKPAIKLNAANGLGVYWGTPGRPNLMTGLTNLRGHGVIVPLANTATFDGIAVNLTASGVAGSVIRAGLYRIDVNADATATWVLLEDSGDWDASVAPTLLTAAFTARTLTPGLYGLALKCETGGAAPQVSGCATDANPWMTIQNIMNGITSGLGAYNRVTAAGAMPDPFAPTSFTGANPWIGLKLAAS